MATRTPTTVGQVSRRYFSSDGVARLALLPLTLLFVLNGSAFGQDLQWVRDSLCQPPGILCTARGQAIAADSSGNSYVTGFFDNFTQLGSTILQAAGSEDIFVSKFSSNGTLVWAKRAGGVDGESGQGIAIDSSGKSYVTGFFFGTAIFGPGETNETSLTSTLGTQDVFVAKYNSDGTLAWAKSAGGGSRDAGLSVAVDSLGNSYVTGYFFGTATFSQAPPRQVTSAGLGDIFVAKYDGNGAVLWVKRAGGTSDDSVRSIAVDSSGNSYVTGDFSGTATFGLGEATQTILTLKRKFRRFSR